MQFELQPHFLQLIKSWEFAQKYLMAKHDGVQKDLTRGETQDLGENCKGQTGRKRKK